MSLFVVVFDCILRKEGRFAMMIGDMDISRLIIYVQQVE